jgi:HEPN domain-containing protein
VHTRAKDKVVDWKKYRESIGYTQAKMSKDANAWWSLAKGYHLAAEILNEAGERIPSDTRQFAFNAALSIELILKAILARKLLDIPVRHDLLLLAERGSIPISDNQKKTLDLLTATLVWSGRYPTPNKEAAWEEYQDSTIEAHIIRTTVGNVHSTMANRETFPDWNNYLKIWNICASEFEKAT